MGIWITDPITGATYEINPDTLQSTGKVVQPTPTPPPPPPPPPPPMPIFRPQPPIIQPTQPTRAAEPIRVTDPITNASYEISPDTLKSKGDVTQPMPKAPVPPVPVYINKVIDKMTQTPNVIKDGQLDFTPLGAILPNIIVAEKVPHPIAAAAIAAGITAIGLYGFYSNKQNKAVIDNALAALGDNIVDLRSAAYVDAQGHVQQFDESLQSWLNDLQNWKEGVLLPMLKNTQDTSIPLAQQQINMESVLKYVPQLDLGGYQLYTQGIKDIILTNPMPDLEGKAKDMMMAVANWNKATVDTIERGIDAGRGLTSDAWATMSKQVDDITKSQNIANFKQAINILNNQYAQGIKRLNNDINNIDKVAPAPSISSSGKALTVDEKAAWQSAALDAWKQALAEVEAMQQATASSTVHKYIEATLAKQSAEAALADAYKSFVVSLNPTPINNQVTPQQMASYAAIMLPKIVPTVISKPTVIADNKATTQPITISDKTTQPTTAPKTKVNTSPITKTLPSTGTLVQQALMTQTKTKTQTQPQTQTQLQTQIATKVATDVLTKTQTKAKTDTQTKTATKTKTDTQTKTADLTDTTTTIPKKIKLKLPDGKELKLTRKQYDSIIAWKQGIMYIARWKPFGKNDIHYSRTPLEGVEYHSGIGSANESLIARGEKTRVKDFDMGIVRVETDWKGNKPVLDFDSKKVEQHKRRVAVNRARRTEMDDWIVGLSKMR